jgi:hypothetical protein
LDFKIFLDMLGGFVVEEAVGILLPGEDFELQAELLCGSTLGLLN